MTKSKNHKTLPLKVQPRLKVQPQLAIERDWKNPKEYEFFQDLEPNQWAWEFLRRNADYRKEWDTETYGQKIIGNAFFPEKVQVTKKGKTTIYFKSDLSKPKKWGIPLYYNPGREFLFPYFYPIGGDIVVIDLTDSEIKDAILGGNPVLGFPDNKTGKVLVKFNFNQPIIPQVNKAKKELLKLQKDSKEKGHTVRKAFKPRRGERILYIRILDALAKKIKPSKIACELFPGDCKEKDPYALKKFDDKREQALRYVNTNYRHIPFYSE